MFGNVSIFLFFFLAKNKHFFGKSSTFFQCSNTRAALQIF